MSSKGEELGKVVEGYRLLELIGSGSQASVYLIEAVDPDAKGRKRVFAGKLFDGALMNGEQLRRLMEEVRILEKVKPCPHMVRLMSSHLCIPADKPSLTPSSPAAPSTSSSSTTTTTADPSKQVHLLVLGIAAQGEMMFYLKLGALPEPICRAFFLQLLDSMEAAHAKHIFHRDLKPDNLVLDKQFWLRVADFGLAKEADPSQLLHSRVGTFKGGYMSAEVASKLPYRGGPADAWALGVILFILIAGFPPFFSASASDWWFRCLTVGQGAAGGGRTGLDLFWAAHERYARFSPELKQLLEGLLSIDPNKRWSLAQARASAWCQVPAPAAAALAPLAAVPSLAVSGGSGSGGSAGGAGAPAGRPASGSLTAAALMAAAALAQQGQATGAGAAAAAAAAGHSTALGLLSGWIASPEELTEEMGRRKAEILKRKEAGEEDFQNFWCLQEERMASVVDEEEELAEALSLLRKAAAAAAAASGGEGMDQSSDGEDAGAGMSLEPQSTISISTHGSAFASSAAAAGTGARGTTALVPSSSSDLSFASEDSGSVTGAAAARAAVAASAGGALSSAAGLSALTTGAGMGSSSSRSSSSSDLLSLSASPAGAAGSASGLSGAGSGMFSRDSRTRAFNPSLAAAAAAEGGPAPPSPGDKALSLDLGLLGQLPEDRPQLRFAKEERRKQRAGEQEVPSADPSDALQPYACPEARAMYKAFSAALEGKL